MFFNNWNALLQARVVASDFARNKHVAFFRGAPPVIKQSQAADSFSNLVNERAADWVCTMTSTRVVTINNAGQLVNFDDISDDLIEISDPRLKELDYDTMDSGIRVSLALARTAGTLSEVAPDEDYTPSWFIVSSPSVAEPLISGDTDDIDFIGEVSAFGTVDTGAVLLKHAVSVGELPKAYNFTMVNFPI